MAEGSCGSPAVGSSAVARARATASSAMRSTEPGSRSLVEVMADRKPFSPFTKTRTPRRRSTAWVTNSVSVAADAHLHAVADHHHGVGVGGALHPGALEGRLCRREQLVAHPSVPPTVSCVDADGRQADADGHALAVLAAGADALVELQVVADPA